MHQEFFTDLYIDNYHKIYTFISHRAMLKCSADADDIVQDVFVLAYSRRDVLENHPNPGGWLMATAKFACMAYNRGKDIKAELTSIDEMYDLDDGYDYEQAIVERIREEQLVNAGAARKALDNLGETDRHIYFLKYVSHLTSKEISQLTGMTVSTVNVRVFRIKEKVRNFIFQDKFALAVEN